MDSIALDIGRKCDDDVAAAISRNMGLVQGGASMAQVAFMGASSALGMSAGAFLAVHKAKTGEQASDEEAADAVWTLLRPMVIRSIARLNSSRAGAL